MRNTPLFFQCHGRYLVNKGVEGNPVGICANRLAIYRGAIAIYASMGLQKI